MEIQSVGDKLHFCSFSKKGLQHLTNFEAKIDSFGEELDTYRADAAADFKHLFTHLHHANREIQVHCKRIEDFEDDLARLGRIIGGLSLFHIVVFFAIIVYLVCSRFL